MKKTLWVLLLGAVAIFILIGCGSREEAGTKAVEKTLEHATGKDVDIDRKGDKLTIEQEGMKTELDLNAKEWPKDMPSEVPLFEGKKITNVTRSQTPDMDNWTVFYESATAEEMGNYENALKKAGFKTVSMKMPQGGTVNGEKGNLIVSCMYSDQRALVGVQRTKE